jgi:hypothetical protein
MQSSSVIYSYIINRRFGGTRRFKLPRSRYLFFLTVMSTRNIKIMFLGSKVRWVRKADNLTAIYEPIVKTVWDP